MYVQRKLKTAVEKARRGFPAVLITGPRQSGKTTFLQAEYGSESHYVSFDDPLQRAFAAEDPNGFLGQFPEKPVILDEIQYVPELFPYLKMIIDTDRSRNGKFLMTGSQQFHLMRNISESLAGRIAILELPPFCSSEYASIAKNWKIEEIIWAGGYPDVVLNREQRDLWIASYIRTYVERDIRHLQKIRDLGLFEQFLGLLAARNGSTLNLSDLSRATGLSVPGCKQWLHLLEAAYVVYLLPPFYNNFGKRLVKAPKILFWDSSIASYLSRQPSPQGMWHGAMGGAFFESWVIMDVCKRLLSHGLRPDLYYWRSRDGLELDLIIVLQGRIFPVEIKQTATPGIKHMQGLNMFRKIAGPNCEQGTLVCTVDAVQAMPGGNKAMGWRTFGKWLESEIA